MSPLALYNEFDDYAAGWLRNLIAAGVIAPGIVDTRSIEDLEPDYVRRFTQVHLFAGIGVWSYALRRAGWPDSRRVFTISCPCQPFSAAGKGGGFDDERHLWPHAHYLIALCGPPVVLGEQVASSDAAPWIDLVCSDMEALEYPFAATPFPAAGVGAPHLRDRAYWMAYDPGQGLEGREYGWGLRAGGRKGSALERSGTTGGLADHDRFGQPGATGQSNGWNAETRTDPRSHSSRLAHDDNDRCNAAPLAGLRAHAEHDAQSLGTSGGMGNPRHGADRPQIHATGAGQPQTDGPANQPGGPSVSSSGVGYANGQYAGWDRGPVSGQERPQDGQHLPVDAGAPGGFSKLADNLGTNPTDGIWADADWLFCRDGKWRPTQPGYVKVVDGPAGSLGPVRPDWLPAETAEEIAFYLRLAEARGDIRTAQALLGEPVEGSWELVLPFPLSTEKPRAHDKADWHLPAGEGGFGNRVGRLRGYGNALTVGQAETFIRTVLEVIPHGV